MKTIIHKPHILRFRSHRTKGLVYGEVLKRPGHEMDWNLVDIHLQVLQFQKKVFFIFCIKIETHSYDNVFCHNFLLLIGQCRRLLILIGWTKVQILYQHI
jgi:hypothetical protein